MAKRFRFSLERILSIRRLEEQIRKNAFAEAQTRLMDAEEAKRVAEKHYTDCAKELASLRRKSPLPIFECLQLEATQNDFKGLIARRAKKVEVRAMEMEKEKEQLIAAAIRRKALDRTRETRRAQYMKERRTAEGKFFDDIAGKRAHARIVQSKSEEGNET